MRRSEPPAEPAREDSRPSSAWAQSVLALNIETYTRAQIDAYEAFLEALDLMEDHKPGQTFTYDDIRSLIEASLRAVRARRP